MTPQPQLTVEEANFFSHYFYELGRLAELEDYPAMKMFLALKVPSHYVDVFAKLHYLNGHCEYYGIVEKRPDAPVVIPWKSADDFMKRWAEVQAQMAAASE